MKIKSYRELHVWQKSMELVIECYRLVEKFPKYEIYGLGSQLRRVVVSVVANIAEGHERSHRKEFIQHLSISYGSLAGVETHLEIAQRLQYIEKEEQEILAEKSATIGRMLNALKRSLTTGDRPSRSPTSET
jgi:four helix bundle protein